MKEFKNELLERLNFNMCEVKLFDSFAGIGSLHNSLTRLGVPVKVTGLSETDIDAIISYACIHVDNFLELDFNYPSEDNMRKLLLERNIGWNFTKQKSSILRLKKDKLYKVYKATILLNNLGDISKIDYNKMEDFDLFNMSFPCFVAGTLVLTDNGYKNIEDIKKGDNVLTHTNTYQKVVKPMINKADSIYRLKTMCSEDLLVTEEHPFYVRKRVKINTRVHGEPYRERKFNNPEWIKVKDLSKDYYVGVAINQKSELPKWEGCVVPRPYNKIKQLNDIKQYFNNEDFWWIVGRYMGDGWVKNNIDCKGTDVYDLYICCAKDELNEITDVLDELNLINNDFKYKYYEDKSTYKIRIANIEFAKFLQQFGKGAKNKELTDSIINLPSDLLRFFVEGYISADGCFTNGIIKCTSVSKKLIFGIGECIAKIYNRPYSIYINKPREKVHKIDGRIIKQGMSYSLNFKIDTCKQDKAFYEDGYIWCPINGLKKEEYNGLVYNMEVENDNSYTANNIIVHNCTDLSNAGKQKGLKNEDGTHTRSGLVKYGIELIKTKKPKYIMIENVKALIQKKFINDFYDICNEIESYGYKIYYPTKEDKKGNKQPMCLNAKNYGIPQNRERIFVICVRNDCNDKIDSFWGGQDFGYRLKDFLENIVDEKYYINKAWHLTTPEEQKHDNNEIAQVDGIQYKATRSVGDTNMICRTLDTMCGGQREPKVLENKLYKIGETEDFNFDFSKRVYSPEGISKNIMASGGNTNEKTGQYSENNLRIRKLTPKECWRLMGFTDEQFDRAKTSGISDSQLYKQAGNSIVVNCLYYIFKELFKNYMINN